MLQTNPTVRYLFCSNGDYNSVIKKFRPESFKKGKIMDLNGNQIGEHDGIINTIDKERNKNFKYKATLCS